MRSYLLSVCLFFCFINILSAGDWQRIHGRFVTVEYTAGFEELADSLVDIADNSIPRLSALHGVALSEFKHDKVRIILTDAPDISNGYAISDAIVIFARSSMYMENWSGPFSWYKQVMEHEMVHHITFRAIKRKSSFLGLVTSATAPRWFMEGIAQYFAESWTMFRGDIYLKESVLNGRFKYDALNNLEDGRLLYAAGHAFVRYLAQQYGDSSLIKLVRYNKDGWFYDFDLAFQAVYDKSPASIFPFFHRHLIIYYGNQAADYPVIDFTETLPSFGYRDLQVIPLETDSSYLVSTVKQENHLYKTAFIAEINQGKIHISEQISDNFSTKLFISPDQQRIAYGRFSFDTKMNQDLIRYDWYVYDRSSRKAEIIATEVRARNAIFDYQDNLFLAVTEADSTFIRKYKANTFIDVYKTDMPIGKMIIDSSNAIIFEAQLKNSQRDFFKLANNHVSNISSDTTENRNPVYINKRYIAENRIINNQPALALLDQKNGTSEVLVNPQSALWLEDYDAKRKKLIVKASDAAGKTHFAGLSLDSLLIKPILPEKSDSKPYYSAWTSKKAKADSIESLPVTAENYKAIGSLSFPQGDLINLQTIPFVFYDNKYGTALFLTTTWMEAMQRQLLNINAYVFPENWHNSFLSAAHLLKLMNINMQTFYYHGPVLFTRINGKSIDLTHDYGQIGFSFNRFINGNSRLPYYGGVSYTLDAVENKSGIIDYTYHGAGLNLSLAYELPSAYRYVFSRRAIRGDVSYFKSFREPWNFSTFNAALYASTNLLIERLGLESTLKYTQVSGSVSPSAITGIDRDYEYNVPRDFRNTQTIRGIDKDIFGNRLLWGSVEMKYFLAEQSGLKLLFIPVNELAVSIFADGAMISDSETTVTSDVYSYGSELSFGFNIIRFSAGVARGAVNSNLLDTQFYGRLNIKIMDLM